MLRLTQSWNSYKNQSCLSCLKRDSPSSFGSERAKNRNNQELLPPMSKQAFAKIRSVTAALVFTLAGNATAQGPEEWYGMTVGYDINVANSDTFLSDMGVKTVRLWAAYNYSDRSNMTIHNKDVFQQARDYKGLGYTVILLIQNKYTAPYADVKAFYDWAKEYRGPDGTLIPVKDAVDYWEVVNELNLEEYWAQSQTASDYVNNVLKAAWDALNPIGEKVIGGSFTAIQGGVWADTAAECVTAQAMVNAGYLSYCHFAGLHPYTDTETRMQNVVNSHKTVFNNKRLILTEWNFKQSSMSSESDMVSRLNNIRAWVKSNTHIACWYRFAQTTSYWGAVTYSGSSYLARQPFYDMYKNWPKALFSQTFSSSTTVSSYVSSTPDGGQFTSIGASGLTTSIANGALRFAAGDAYNYGSFVRNVDFSGPPAAVSFQFDFTLSGNSEAGSHVFYVGDTFENGNGDEASADIFAKATIAQSTTAGNYSVNGITFTGKKTFKWYLNNSGAAKSYTAPDGTTQTLASERYDLWIGNTQAYNEAPATTATQTIRNIKYRANASYTAFTVDIDNVQVTLF